jgi:hypothetical protein
MRIKPTIALFIAGLFSATIPVLTITHGQPPVRSIHILTGASAAAPASRDSIRMTSQ